jgi:hypothetical protein
VRTCKLRVVENFLSKVDNAPDWHKILVLDLSLQQVEQSNFLFAHLEVALRCHVMDRDDLANLVFDNQLLELHLHLNSLTAL